MDIWTVENGELVLYRRSGECKRCGACCRDKIIVYEMEVSVDSGNRDGEDNDDSDWSCREGQSMFLAQGIWWYFNIPEVKDDSQLCPKLTSDNECSEWNTESFRPICKYWPFHPRNIEKFPKCGFRFEQYEDTSNDKNT